MTESFMRGATGKQILASFGFSVVLAVITISRMDASGGVNAAILCIVFSMAIFLLVIALCAAASIQVLDRILASAYIVFLPLSIIMFMVCGSDSLPASVLMGAGIACGYTYWGKVFTSLHRGMSLWPTIAMMALWGIEVFIIASAADFITRNIIMLALVIAGLIPLVVLLRTERGEDSGNDALDRHQQGSNWPEPRIAIKSAFSTLQYPILVVLILGFTSGFFRAFLPDNGTDLSVINLTRFVCTAIACGLILYLQIKEKGAINIFRMFTLSLIAVASVFALFPFVAIQHQITLLAVIDCIYMLMMFYLIEACAISAQRNQIPAYLTFGLADGIVSLAVGVSFVSRYVPEAIGVSLPFPAVIFSLLVLYILVISLVFQNVATSRKITAEKGDKVVQVIIGYSENMLRSNVVLKDQYQITDREMDVLILALGGQNARSIAQMLFISENTVRTHLKRMYRKLNVHSKEELHRLIGSIVEPLGHTRGF